MEFDSSSSSSDDEVFDLLGAVDRVKVFRARPNPFEKYSRAEFRARYRFSPETIFLIGAFQILVGDDYGIHKSTVSRVIEKVSECLAELRPNFVKMPESNAEKVKVKQGFYAIGNFPNVIGCVDGSHIPIESPGGDNAELFRNRKSFFSINVQAVCDSSLFIRDIVVRWPGSTHDSTIWNSSLVGARFEAGDFQGSFILGDSAYRCTSYCMTPLLNPETQSEIAYNKSHIKTRNCIERCFGVWKRRFPCLYLGLRTKLETSLTIIVATSVLHNIAVKENDPSDDFEEDHNIPAMDVEMLQGVNEENGNVRRGLIETAFR
ncbi:hypothetical protein RN001_002506 [Aquatica leii]|uniref:DDE Tnp4 domain-containing protein n=1 Tax=Aquatica leii TaxID=1421715 RepID=A0AAN7QB55_9COLE|nr:hypothetical protein RN001_002506 [Aquatica leii]